MRKSMVWEIADTLLKGGRGLTVPEIQQDLPPGTLMPDIREALGRLCRSGALELAPNDRYYIRDRGRLPERPLGHWRGMPLREARRRLFADHIQPVPSPTLPPASTMMGAMLRIALSRGWDRSNVEVDEQPVFRLVPPPGEEVA